MEFEFNCSKLLKPSAAGFARLDGLNGNPFVKNPAAPQGRHSGIAFGAGASSIGKFSEADQLDSIIDKMGAASAKAQGLPQIITTAVRFFGSDNRLYLKVESNQVIGLIKVGARKLFIRSENGKLNEITPLCVLDFYVHESVQRGGMGKQIFEEMLAREAIRPEKMGYDRPSEKLIGFLRKHYGLKNYVP